MSSGSGRKPEYTHTDTEKTQPSKGSKGVVMEENLGRHRRDQGQFSFRYSE